MDDRSAFDFIPQISAGNRQLFTRVRLLSIAGLFLAMLVASLIAP
jgi:hypothetical protein